jgi:hypothetical protein
MLIGGTLLVSLSSSFSSAPAQAAAISPTAVVVPCSDYVAMAWPLFMIIASGDGSVVATNLSWSSWVAPQPRPLGGLQPTTSSRTEHSDSSGISSLLCPDRSANVDGDMRYLKVTVTYLHKRPYGGEAPWGKRSNTYIDSERSLPVRWGTLTTGRCRPSPLLARL